MDFTMINTLSNVSIYSILNDLQHVPGVELIRWKQTLSDIHYTLISRSFHELTEGMISIVEDLIEEACIAEVELAAYNEYDGPDEPCCCASSNGICDSTIDWSKVAVPPTPVCPNSEVEDDLPL